MAMEIEQLLRANELTPAEKQIIFRGIVQMAKADGEDMDPREKEFLQQVVTEFFPGLDFPELLKDWKPLDRSELDTLSSNDNKATYLAFLYMIAYADENFSDAEKNLLKDLTRDLLPGETVEELESAVRAYLYRRSVFHFVLNQNFLHPEFAKEMARRFEVSEQMAIFLNQEVYNAVMVLHGQPEPGPEQNA